MKVCFWSPAHGTSSTANMLAIAISISEQLQQKVLITQTHYFMNNMEKPLLGNMVSDNFFNETGMDALIRHYKSGYLTGEQIENCSISILNNLSIVAGTKNCNKYDFETDVNRNIITKIVKKLELYCDVLLVDLNSGESRISYDILEDCDIVVVSLRQNKDMIDDLMKNDFFENKKLFYLFGNYDEDSKYSLGNIRKLYKSINKENSGLIPHCTGYMDAISDDRVIRYFQNNMVTDDYSYEDSFFENIGIISKQIIQLAGKGKEIG